MTTGASSVGISASAPAPAAPAATADDRGFGDREQRERAEPTVREEEAGERPGRQQRAGVGRIDVKAQQHHCCPWS